MWRADSCTHLLCLQCSCPEDTGLRPFLKETGAVLSSPTFNSMQFSRRGGRPCPWAGRLTSHITPCRHSDITVTILVRYKTDKPKLILFYRSTVWRNKKLKKIFPTYLSIKYQNRLWFQHSQVKRADWRQSSNVPFDNNLFHTCLHWVFKLLWKYTFANVVFIIFFWLEQLYSKWQWQDIESLKQKRKQGKRSY